jgi:SAM-dependent methyltransferase
MFDGTLNNPHSTHMGAQPIPISEKFASDKCPLCGTSAEACLRMVRDTISREAFDILFCPTCRIGITNPRPDDLNLYYKVRYYGSRHSFTASLCVQRRKRLVARVASKPGRLLDIGCGDGSFLIAERNAGWRVFGTELHGTEQLPGCPIFRRPADAAEHGPFDCITMWHVLEHVPEPLHCLNELRQMLAPGGVLLLAVPDFGGWQAKLFGRHWLHADVPRHLFHFTSDSLDKMLSVSGYQVTDRWHQEVEYDVFGWIQSALNSFRPTANVLFDSLAGRPARVSRTEVYANYFAAMALAAPALAVTLISTSARCGGTLIVAARVP